jgi:hypothetical protein
MVPALSHFSAPMQMRRRSTKTPRPIPTTALNWRTNAPSDADFAAAPVAGTRDALYQLMVTTSRLAQVTGPNEIVECDVYEFTWVLLLQETELALKLSRL